MNLYTSYHRSIFFGQKQHWKALSFFFFLRRKGHVNPLCCPIIEQGIIISLLLTILGVKSTSQNFFGGTLHIGCEENAYRWFLQTLLIEREIHCSFFIKLNYYVFGWQLTVYILICNWHAMIQMYSKFCLSNICNSYNYLVLSSGICSCR